MKVKFVTDELKKRLSQLGSVVAKKAAQPVYSFVRLYALESEGKYTVGMQGVDIDATLAVQFTGAEADGAVDILLPYAKLVDILGGVSAKESTIEAADETKATFKSGKYRAELKAHPLENWPAPIERPESSVATVALPGFKAQIANVEFAVPPSDGKHVVAVVKVESTAEKLRLVATDGFRLAISDVPGNAGEFNLILPKPALELLKKLEGGQLTISEAEAGFYFDTELETLTVSRSYGEFPNYSVVIPKSSKTVITVEKGALAESVKRTKPLADPERPKIRFGVEENGASLVLEAIYDEAGTDGGTFRNMASDDIDAKVTGPAVGFALDANLLQPFIDQATGPIEIRVNTAQGVIDFGAANGERPLQMPRREK